MNLVDYGRILLRRGWIIILLAVIAAGSTYFLSTRQTKIYRSVQKVLIQPSRIDLGLTEASKTLLNNFVSYIDSEKVAAQVINNLKLDMTPGYLKSKTSIAPQPLSMTIEIDVDLPDPDLANRVSTEWGNMLVQYRNQENQKSRREEQVGAQLQDFARAELYSPRLGVNAAAGGVLGLLLGVIVVFILEYLESSVVRRRDDLERQIDIPVIAALPADLEG
jgi:capsular polysaccharide biosynthesis protein